MADKNKPEPQNITSEHPVKIHQQFIRDLSFENVTAPEESGAPQSGGPDVQVEVNVQARELEKASMPNSYEVMLRLRVTATLPDTPIFMIELDYTTILTVDEKVPKENHHALLFIEIPRYSFPYAAQIISTTCVQGGFPPFFLTPVDFHALYMERFKDELAEAKSDYETKNGKATA